MKLTPLILGLAPLLALAARGDSSAPPVNSTEKAAPPPAKVASAAPAGPTSAPAPVPAVPETAAPKPDAIFKAPTPVDLSFSSTQPAPLATGALTMKPATGLPVLPKRPTESGPPALTGDFLAAGNAKNIATSAQATTEPAKPKLTDPFNISVDHTLHRKSVLDILLSRSPAFSPTQPTTAGLPYLPRVFTEQEPK